MSVLNEKIKELWVAHIYFLKSGKEIKFNYSPMEVVKQYPFALEMRYPYFIGSAYSTRYFEEGMLDKEYEITKELTVFYSADKEKCVAWLENKRSELLQSYKFNYERLKKSEIKEVEEKVD